MSVKVVVENMQVTFAFIPLRSRSRSIDLRSLGEKYFPNGFMSSVDRGAKLAAGHPPPPPPKRCYHQSTKVKSTLILVKTATRRKP